LKWIRDGNVEGEINQRFVDDDSYEISLISDDRDNERTGDLGSDSRGQLNDVKLDDGKSDNDGTVSMDELSFTPADMYVEESLN
jgi:hypothetical protein